MKRWKWFLAATITSGLLLAPLQPSNADDPGHGLLIKSPHVGTLYLYITEKGFAIVIPKTGAKIVTHDPDWRLVMYNDKTKVYYVERMEEVQAFVKKGGTMAKQAQIARRTSMQHARKGLTQMIAGIPATQYFVNTYSSDGGAKQAEAWISSQLHPPKKLSEMLGKIFSLDTSNFPAGMPMRVKLSDEAGKRELIFDTLTCQKQVIKSASFNYPASYKRVDNEIAVIVDEQSRKKMESILEDTDELNSILGPSTATRNTNYKPSYNSYSKPSTTTTTRPTTTAAKPKPPAQNGDWWNIFSNFGIGK